MANGRPNVDYSTRSDDPPFPGGGGNVVQNRNGATVYPGHAGSGGNSNGFEGFTVDRETHNLTGGGGNGSGGNTSPGLDENTRVFGNPGGTPSGSLDASNGGPVGVTARPGGSSPGPGHAGRGSAGVNTTPGSSGGGGYGHNIGNSTHGYVCPRPDLINRGQACPPPPPCPSSGTVYGGYGTRYNYSWCDTYWGWSRTYSRSCGMRYWYGGVWVTGWSFRTSYCGYNNVYVRTWDRERVILRLDPCGEFCWEIYQQRVWVPGFYRRGIFGLRVWEPGYWEWQTISSNQVYDTYFDWSYIGWDMY